ncbi:MAG TPA: hypothetical protein VI386_23830 [Candidatus Sulfotelmatobacter sp.]
MSLRHSFRVSRSRFFVYLGVTLAATGILCPVPCLARDRQPPASTLRWDEATPGCTFSQTSDGKYDYGMQVNDVHVIVSVDSQELEKVRRRHELFFSVLVSVKYRGSSAIDVHPENISLEFVRHFRVVQTSLDPNDFSQKVQNDADEFDRQIAREVQKHPEQKTAKEAQARNFQKDSAELLEFISKNTLKPSHLDSASRDVSGWAMFSTENKWIGAWKKEEEFIVRVPIAGEIFEFPFKLPPKPGELLLRNRQ